MKRFILPLFALAISLTALTTSLLSRGPKIAYAETSVLITEFDGSVKARKEFEEAQKVWDRNLDLLNDSLVATVDMMKAEYASAPPARKQEMRALLEKRNDDLQRYSNAVKNQAETKERELMEPVIKKVNSFLEVWGREKGYDLVLGTTVGGNILQANTDLNITQRVLADMNAHYKDLAEKPVAGKNENPKASKR